MRESKFIILICVVIVVLLVASGMLLFKKTGTKSEKSNPQVTLSPVEQKRAVFDERGELVANVKVSSEVPNYIVAMDKQQLLVLLQNWGIYGKSYSTSPTNTPGMDVVNTVHFILTNQPQKTLKIARNPSHVESTAGLSFNQSEMVVKVQIDPQQLPEATQYFEYQALHILYGLSHPYAPNDKNAYANGENAYAQFLKEKDSKKITYLTVEKK